MSACGFTNLPTQKNRRSHASPAMPRIRIERDQGSTNCPSCGPRMLTMWTTAMRRRLMMLGENPLHHILIYRGPERQVDLLGDTRAAHVGLRCFISMTARMRSASRCCGWRISKIIQPSASDNGRDRAPATVTKRGCLSVMPSSQTPSLQTLSLMQSAELHSQPLWVLDLEAGLGGPRVLQFAAL